MQSEKSGALKAIRAVALFRACSPIQRLYIQSVLRPYLEGLGRDLRAVEQACASHNAESAVGLLLALALRMPRLLISVGSALRAVLPTR